MKLSLLKPLLPLRDIVIFPSMVAPLFVGREKSIKALQEVMKSDKSIVLVTQKNSEVDDPDDKDLYQYGCLSKVLQLLKLPDGTVKVLVEGEKRVKILKHNDNKNFFASLLGFFPGAGRLWSDHADLWVNQYLPLRRRYWQNQSEIQCPHSGSRV